MKYLHLLRLFFRFSFMSATEYRLNFYLYFFESLLMLGTGISVLWVVFSQTTTIAGWGWHELLVVMGLYFIGYGLVGMTIGPSIKEFMQDVWRGNLDFLLVKPSNHQFLASTRKIVFWNLVSIAIGVAITGVALVRLRAAIGPEQSLMFGLSLGAGAALIYSFWVCLGVASIWTTRMENIMLLYYHLYEAGKWPIAAYPGWLKYTLTFVVPVAFAINVPAEAVIGRLSWSFVALAMTFAVASLLGSRWLFQFGVRRYTSASS